MIQCEPYPIIEKTYEMDTISIKSLRGSRITDNLYHPIHRIFSILYLSLGALRPVFDKVIELRKIAGVSTNFLPTEPRGSVRVLYKIHTDEVEIEAYTKLIEGCVELIMLNEQGASVFRRCDFADSTLIDDKIGAWEKINASEATLSTLDGDTSFTVFRPAKARLLRGRERIRGRLSWAGLTLSFDARDVVDYRIKLDSKPRQK